MINPGLKYIHGRMFIPLPLRNYCPAMDITAVKQSNAI
jgi:hypothetical protein